MDTETRRRPVKVIRVLCDGCERASASVYCTDCNECACHVCAEQLHTRGRRSSKRPAARTCKGRYLKDLEKSVGVLALCIACRSRPAYRYSSGEVYALCQECRSPKSSPEQIEAQGAAKQSIGGELRRSSKTSESSASSAAGASSASRRRQKHHHQHGHHKPRRERHVREDDSTGDDATDPYSRNSSAD